MSKFKWGILGCGRIARSFCEDLANVQDAEVYAVASQSGNRLREFANDFGAQKQYNNYIDLVKDESVDAIYVATPHSYHKEHSILCLKHQKPVLCEKPFALDADETKKMIDVANENSTFIMDAFWVRFLPIYKDVLQMVENKTLGDLKMMRSDFGFNAPFDPMGRLYNKSLGGGSLMDIGVYPVFATLLFMGFPNEIKTISNIGKTDVDEQIAVVFGYNDGRLANMYASIEVESPVDVDLYFEKGWVRIQRTKKFFRQLIVNEKDQPQKMKTYDIQGYGLHFEAEEVMRCVREGVNESPMMPHQFTIQFLEVIDKIKAQAGISYV